MSEYRRLYRPGSSYFFTVTLANRSDAGLTEHISELRMAFRATLRERPFRCDAIVVLPDHLHAIWTLPAGDSDFSTRWGAIKARFTMSLRRAGFIPPDRLPTVQSGRYAGVNPGLRRHKGEVGLWQRRFWEHCIRDEADFERHLKYCWGNPVKHGYVQNPIDWPYSSIPRDIAKGGVPNGWMQNIEGDFGEP